MQESFEEERLRVYVRIRPFLQRELEDKSSYPVLDVRPNRRELHIYEFLNSDLYSEEKVLEMLKNPRHFQVHVHNFNEVFDQQNHQEYIYKKCGETCLERLLGGFNSSVIAYGQTGTGKTYTMEGPSQIGSQRGLIPRILEGLFRVTAGLGQREVVVKASYVQIYNETLSDLLRPKNQKNLTIRQDKFLGMIVENLSEFELKSKEQAMELFKKGSQNRISASTKMNELSSRSHAIFTIRIEQIIDEETTVCAKINLVDLAGSERISITGATGLRLEECKKINQSLSELSNVIWSLTKKNQFHIPYRNSKLTHLLGDSLGGNSSTFLIATVSPASGSFSETLSTLKFASRAKDVTNSVHVNRKKNEVSPSNIYKTFNQEYAEYRKKGEESKSLLMLSDSGQDVSQENEIERYKELLVRQRDVVIQLTTKLNTRDHLILLMRKEIQHLRQQNANLRQGEHSPVYAPVLPVANEVKEIKGEIDHVIFSLTQKNSSFDLQKIASSILNVQKILDELSKKI